MLDSSTVLMCCIFLHLACRCAHARFFLCSIVVLHPHARVPYACPPCLLCLQLGESLEEQLGQRLMRMPPPPQLPPRVRQGQQHMIEQHQQPAMFQLPQEIPPVLGDPMQVGDSA
jgi:hypothetical protein